MKKTIKLFLLLVSIFNINISISQQSNTTNLLSKKKSLLDSIPLDGVYDKKPKPKPIPYPPLREADIFWAKRIWRVIDLREKMNQPFYYPITQINGRRSLMQILFEGIKEGILTAYDPSSDEFLVPETYEMIMKLLNKKDSMQVEVADPNNQGQTISKDTVIAKPFDPASVKQIRIKEDWFFDKQRSVMEVRILGICPIIELFEADGVTSKGHQPLFWIYFPEVRPILINELVFNRFNQASELSYDDVFMKRMFTSTIIKESNVYDRNIGEYAKSMDALLESERIKNQIFLMEHDLWEY